MPVGEEGPFEPEIRVAPLVEHSSRHAPTFGLVVVALWPADETLRAHLLESYYRLRALTELCFAEEDVARRDGSTPPVYFYPFTALHVTIATLHAVYEQPPGQVLSEERQDTLRKVWSQVLHKASRLDEWPSSSSLEFFADHAQIGNKAGILLWKETTGGIDQMRQCLETVCAQPETVIELERHRVSVDTVAIPKHMIHSTFLRFYATPATPAQAVRRRFQSTVLPRLRSELFPHPVRWHEARLVCESTPYMHQPVHDSTFAVFPLGDNNSKPATILEATPSSNNHGAAAPPHPDPEEFFEPDVRLAPLVEKDKNQFTETFGLTLVTAWPAGDSLRRNLLEPYYRLCALTELCFAEADVACRGNGTVPPVYLYPFTALHVSVVVLHAFYEQPPGTVLSPERQETLQNAWSVVLQQAAALHDWPTQPLELVLDGAQLNGKAGILLWKESTGGLAKMRACVQQICARSDTVVELQQQGVSVDTLMVPNMIHTTFLRFYQTPTTPLATARQRFERTVVPRLSQLFSQPFRVPDARLICERTPYMHIPVDDATLETFLFAS